MTISTAFSDLLQTPLEHYLTRVRHRGHWRVSKFLMTRVIPNMPIRSLRSFYGPRMVVDTADGSNGLAEMRPPRFSEIGLALL